MIKFKLDTAKVIQAIKDKNDAALQACAKGLLLGMTYFEGKFEKEQLSIKDGTPPARRTTLFGLRRPTGTLARSWRVFAEGFYKTDYRVVLSSASQYAAIHQFGGNTGRGGRTYIPKRLYLIEDYKKSGTEIIVKAMKKELLKLK